MCYNGETLDVGGFSMKIGFFDSGIGGLTVLYEAMTRFSQHEFIYYADSDHAPYGPQPKSLVRSYIFEAVAFLVSQQVDAIVIACNTATSVAISDLREQYEIPIIGMEPAVKPALEVESDRSRVLVTATPLTVKEEKLAQLISRLNSSEVVDLVALPQLVSFAEQFDFSDATIISYLRESFEGIAIGDYKAVVMGCTHFPLFTPQYRQIFGKTVVFIDGSHGTINRLADVLQLEELKDIELRQRPYVTYYRSGVVANEQEVMQYERILAKLAMIKTC